MFTKNRPVKILKIVHTYQLTESLNHSLNNISTLDSKLAKYNAKINFIIIRISCFFYIQSYSFIIVL